MEEIGGTECALAGVATFSLTGVLQRAFTPWTDRKPLSGLTATSPEPLPGTLAMSATRSPRGCREGGGQSIPMCAEQAQPARISFKTECEKGRKK